MYNKTTVYTNVNGDEHQNSKKIIKGNIAHHRVASLSLCC